MRFLMFNLAVTAAIVYVIAFETASPNEQHGEKALGTMIAEMLGFGSEEAVTGPIIDPVEEANKRMAQMEADILAEIRGASEAADPLDGLKTPEKKPVDAIPTKVVAADTKPSFTPSLLPQSITSAAMPDVGKTTTALKPTAPLDESPAEPKSASDVASSDQVDQETTTPASPKKPKTKDIKESAKTLLASVEPPAAQEFAGMILPTKDQGVIQRRAEILGTSPLTGGGQAGNAVTGVDAQSTTKPEPKTKAAPPAQNTEVASIEEESQLAGPPSASVQRLLDEASGGVGSADRARELLELAEAAELLALGKGVE